MTKRRVTVQILNTKNQLCWDPLIICKADETIAELVKQALASYCKQGGQTNTVESVISIRTRNEGSSVTIADDQATVEDALGPETVLTLILQQARNVLTSSVANNAQLATPSSSIAPSIDLYEATISPATEKQNKNKPSASRKRRRKPERSSTERSKVASGRKEGASIVRTNTDTASPIDYTTKRVRRATSTKNIDIGAIPRSATKNEQHRVIYDSQPSAEEDSRSEIGLKIQPDSDVLSKKKDYHLSLLEENQHMLEKIDHPKIASQDHEILSTRNDDTPAVTDLQPREARKLQLSRPQQAEEEIHVPPSKSSSTSTSSGAVSPIVNLNASLPPASKSVRITDENGETFEISTELLELAEFLSDSEDSQTATNSASNPRPVQSTHTTSPKPDHTTQANRDLNTAEDIKPSQAHSRAHHTAKLTSPIKTPTKAPPRLATSKRILDAKPQNADQPKITPNSTRTLQEMEKKPTDYFDSPRSIFTTGDIEKRPKLSSHGFYSLSSIHNQGTPLASPVRADNAKSALEKLSQFTEGSSGEDSDTSSNESEPSHNPPKTLKTAISKPAKESAARRALQER